MESHIVLAFLIRMYSFLHVLRNNYFFVFSRGLKSGVRCDGRASFTLELQKVFWQFSRKKGSKLT